MAPRFLECTQCAELFKLGDARCPHCESPAPRERAVVRPAAAVLVGLSLSACTAQPIYGVPDTESATESAAETEDRGHGDRGHGDRGHGDD